MYRIFREQPTGREYWYGRRYSRAYAGFWASKVEDATTFTRYNTAASVIYYRLPQTDRDHAYVETVTFLIIRTVISKTLPLYWTGKTKRWTLDLPEAHVYKTRQAAELALLGKLVSQFPRVSRIIEVSDWPAPPTKGTIK